MANPSLTTYPVSTGDDGIVGGGSNTSWALARSASGGVAYNAQTSSYMGYGSNNAGDTNTYYIYRTFLGRFDLSSVPAGASIVSATLSVYSTGTVSYTSGGGTTANNSAVLVAGTQASSLTTADFGAVGSTELASGRLAYSTFGSAGYKDFTLNAAGLAHLQAAIGSSAKFAIRCGYDFDNTAPVNTGYSGGIAYFSEQSGTANDAKLVVTYSLDRATSDTWAWSDSALNAGVDEADGDRVRTTADAWAWSDSAAPYRRSTVEVTVTDQGPNTLLNQAGGVIGATITVDDTTGFDSSGTLWIIDNTKSTQQQAVGTYTGKTGTTFTGCSWTSVIGRSTYADGSLNFDDNSGVAAPNSEAHFPQVTKLDTTSTPPLMVSYQSHGGHAALRGKLAYKLSTNGGITWGAERYIVSSPANGSAWGVFGHTVARLKNGRIVALWYEHKLDYTAAGSIADFRTMLSYSDDSAVSWSTPVQVPLNMGYSNYDGTNAFGCMVYTGAGSNSTYGDLYFPVVGNRDGIQVHATAETLRFETWLYKITDGGAAGTATKVAEVIKPSQTGGRAAGESDICIAENGDWLIHTRVEALDSESSDERDRWQVRSTDAGVTWGTPVKVIDGFSNGGKITKLPGGTLISTGGPILGTDPYVGNTASVLSHDNGTTWTRSLKYEAVDATYFIYNGADTEVIIDDPSTLVNTAFTYAQERNNQVGARTRFRWYVDPVKRAADTWAWSDAAVVSARTFARPVADTWTWSDVASGSLNGYASRTTTDTWAWTDTATQTATRSRSTTDSWAWSDTGSLPIASYYSRTTTDTWAWTDTSGTNAATIYWMRQRSSMSDTSKTYTALIPKGTTRTSTYTSPTGTAKSEPGILVVLDVTAASGTGGLTLRVNAVDQASGQSVALNAAPTAVTGTGTYSYALYPFGAVAGNVTQATSFYLPRSFNVTVAHGDSSSYTYSLGYCLLP